MNRRLLSGAAMVLLMVACVSKPVVKAPPPKPVAAKPLPKPFVPAGADPRFLVRQPAFTNCELEAFSALSIARNALVLKYPQATLLAVKTNTPLQVGMINEVYSRMQADKPLTDHGRYAAEKFYQCTQRQKLPLSRNLNSASVCFARQDILYHLNTRRDKGVPQAEAVTQIKALYDRRAKTVYPDELVDQLAPMAYRAISENGAFELRRFSLETCLVPKDWGIWWNSLQASPAAPTAAIKPG